MQKVGQSGRPFFMREQSVRRSASAAIGDSASASRTSLYRSTMRLIRGFACLGRYTLVRSALAYADREANRGGLARTEYAQTGVERLFAE